MMIDLEVDLSELSDAELQKGLSYHKTQASLKDSGQQVRKILANSGYGAMAEIRFPLYDLRLAKSITMSGQLSIKWGMRKTNEFLNKILNTDGVDYVIYCDSDSQYVGVEALVQKCNMQNKSVQEITDFLDGFCKNHLEPELTKAFEGLKDYTNAYKQMLYMDREVIAENAIFCSKKRYAMSVWDSEGVSYSDPYIKMMGLDVVKSSTPEPCRVAMKECIKKILNSSEEDTQNYIQKFKKEFKDMDVHEISFPRGVNKLEESYCRPDGTLRTDVTVPINSRAAINYNRELDNLGLEDYEKIFNGDKIKFVHLTLPNRLQQNVIGMVDTLPEEFKLHHKIDYDTMFYKTFLKPIDAIMQIIGWEAVPTPTLEAFFVDTADAEPKKTTVELQQDIEEFFDNDYN